MIVISRLEHLRESNVLVLLLVLNISLVFRSDRSLSIRLLCDLPRARGAFLAIYEVNLQAVAVARQALETSVHHTLLYVTNAGIETWIDVILLL